MIELYRDNELAITLDPVRVEERFPSTVFNFVAHFKMPFQETTICIKEYWIAHEELNAFEQALLDLTERESGEAVLKNMSERSVLTIRRSTDSASFSVSATDTANIGKATLEVNGHAADIRGIWHRLRDFPKWW